MTMVSLGLRSSRSCDSLQQHLHNSLLHVQTTPPFSNRKNAKILKEKENLFHWICKFAGRKKVGMLLLCIIYAAVFGWVLYMGKGEDAMQSMRLNTSSPLSDPDFYWHRNNDDSSFSITWNSLANVDNMAQSLPPPVYFTGYTLPPGNPCETLTLPPPPADKKRTGPRHVKINFSEHFANNLSIEAYVHQAPLNGKPVFPACPVCYLPVEDSIALMPTAPSFSPVLKHLNYIHEDTLTRTEFGGSQFGGYPSLMQRNVSYDIKESMSVHCGFVRGNRPGHQTGFDFDDSDLLAMEECRGIVVASAVFGAYDLINEPKNISETAKKKVCFFMFVDEETEAFLKNSSNWDPKSKKIGLWRTAVVNNLPYADPRRNGKVPKLLLHRLFPNVRYSLWIDAKLELVVDPYQILERFLWRENASFAISRHYKRFDTFIEAEANKAAGKYDNASIDFQADFYRREGLQPYSETKLPITSDVPEGCVIVREHIPITNLFTCLWFNEVDRFTSRDQISFAIVRDKVSAKTNWTINMFLDCERRNFVIQGYHRDVLEHWAPPSPPGSINIVSPPPPVIEVTPNGTTQSILKEDIVANPIKHLPTKRRREKRSGSMRHRKVAAG